MIVEIGNGSHITATPRSSGWHCDNCKRKLTDRERCLYTLAIDSPTRYRMIVECLQCAGMPLFGGVSAI